MKKFLSILSSFGLVISCSTSSISCHNKIDKVDISKFIANTNVGSIYYPNDERQKFQKPSLLEIWRKICEVNPSTTEIEFANAKTEFSVSAYPNMTYDAIRISNVTESTAKVTGVGVILAQVEVVGEVTVRFEMQPTSKPIDLRDIVINNSVNYYTKKNYPDSPSLDDYKMGVKEFIDVNYDRIIGLYNIDPKFGSNNKINFWVLISIKDELDVGIVGNSEIVVE